MKSSVQTFGESKIHLLFLLPNHIHFKAIFFKEIKIPALFLEKATGGLLHNIMPTAPHFCSHGTQQTSLLTFTQLIMSSEFSI